MIDAMGLLSSSTSDFFGLDIGTSGLRVVKVRHTGAGNPVLEAYASVDLPAGLAISDSAIDQDKVALAIRDLLKSKGITCLKAVAGIADTDAFATVITTPKLNPAELSKAMRLQADQYIPMAVDQVKMDWHIIGPGKTADEMKVLLVAAPNSVVNKYLSIVEKAGLELAALEINAVAQARSLMPPSNLAVIVLDIGHNNTELTIVFEGTPQLVRSVNIGGQTLVRAVTQALGLEETQASQFMQKFGLTQTKLEGQVAKAMKPSLDALMSEVDKSIKYFLGQNTGIKIEKLIATGATSALPEFTTFLANASGLPVEFGNPWVNISYPAELQQDLMQNASTYAVAAGLALRTSV